MSLFNDAVRFENVDRRRVYDPIRHEHHDIPVYCSIATTQRFAAPTAKRLIPSSHNNFDREPPAVLKTYGGGPAPGARRPHVSHERVAKDEPCVDANPTTFLQLAFEYNLHPICGRENGQRFKPHSARSRPSSGSRFTGGPRMAPPPQDAGPTSSTYAADVEGWFLADGGAGDADPPTVGTATDSNARRPMSARTAGSNASTARRSNLFSSTVSGSSMFTTTTGGGPVDPFLERLGTPPVPAAARFIPKMPTRALSDALFGGRFHAARRRPPCGNGQRHSVVAIGPPPPPVDTAALLAAEVAPHAIATPRPPPPPLWRHPMAAVTAAGGGTTVAGAATVRGPPKGPATTTRSSREGGAPSSATGPTKKSEPLVRSPSAPHHDDASPEGVRLSIRLFELRLAQQQRVARYNLVAAAQRAPSSEDDGGC